MHLKRVSFHPKKYPTKDHYPFNLPVFHGTQHIQFKTPVSIFVGENGSGKSTLLEAISHRCAYRELYHLCLVNFTIFK